MVLLGGRGAQRRLAPIEGVAARFPCRGGRTRCTTDGFGNTRCNDGGGWRRDNFGNTYGTGNRAGSGWRRNGFGNTFGTGSNAGSGFRTDNFGNTFGTGRNAGGGFRESAAELTYSGICGAIDVGFFARSNALRPA